MSRADSSNPRPVAVGGVGGSGTRVVAEILQALGYFLGDDLNESRDNLWFSLLFKWRGVDVLPEPAFAALYRSFEARMSGRAGSLPADAVEALLAADRAGKNGRQWLEQRLDTFSTGPRTGGSGLWGWKEPNTHRVLERIARLDPGLRYIHVVRNGLDMALSANQNQLRLWGPAALQDRYEDSARGALAFWCWAHRRIERIGETLGERFLWLDFDALCAHPLTGVARILDFLGIDGNEALLGRLAALVGQPETRGRYRRITDCGFDPADVEYVASKGFPVY